MNNKTAAIIVAGGTGSRMGADIPKQFIKLNGKEILLHTLEAFAQCSFINKIVVVCHNDYLELCRSLVLCIKKEILVVGGGNTRQESVLKGLNEAFDCQYVLVHDAVRCLVDSNDVKRLHEELLKNGSCTLAVKAKDTIKMSDENNIVTSTIPREYLWQIQTPQAFLLKELAQAHNYALNTHFEATDDCSVMEHFGKTIKLVEGSYKNIKITTQSDLEIAKVFMKGSEKV